jgi:hypothetical protein
MLLNVRCQNQIPQAIRTGTWSEDNFGPFPILREEIYWSLLDDALPFSFSSHDRTIIQCGSGRNQYRLKRRVLSYPVLYACVFIDTHIYVDVRSSIISSLKAFFLNSPRCLLFTVKMELWDRKNSSYGQLERKRHWQVLIIYIFAAC